MKIIIIIISSIINMFLLKNPHDNPQWLNIIHEIVEQNFIGLSLSNRMQSFLWGHIYMLLKLKLMAFSWLSWPWVMKNNGKCMACKLQIYRYPFTLLFVMFCDLREELIKKVFFLGKTKDKLNKVSTPCLILLATFCGCGSYQFLSSQNLCLALT